MNALSTLVVGAAPHQGSEDFYRGLLGAATRVIAADAAGEWCLDLGRSPDLVVGDFDSSALGAESRLADAGVEVVRLHTDKDISDLDACVAEARTRRWGPLVFTASFVGRMDHTMAALGTVMRASDLGACVEEPWWTARLLDSAYERSITLKLPAGEVFSVVTPTGADGVTVCGARYGLDRARLEPLSSLALSNVSLGAEVSVGVESGSVFVVVPRGPVSEVSPDR